jgi:hypothetical protein
MPRKSPFSIVLTPDEKQELNHRAARYTLPYFQVVRAKIVLLAQKICPTSSLRLGWILDAKSSANGANASTKSACAGSKNFPARVAPGLFPPELVVQVKALACELPSQFGLPLSRWSLSELKRAGLSIRVGSQNQ